MFLLFINVLFLYLFQTSECITVFNKYSHFQIAYIEPFGSDQSYRLALDLKPNFYHVYVRVLDDAHQEPKTFNGSIEIQFECVKKTNLIILHASNLEIDGKSIHVRGLMDVNFNVVDVDWYIEEEHELFVARLPVNLKLGQRYSLYLEYTGIVNSNNLGLYKSSYEEDGSQK